MLITVEDSGGRRMELRWGMHDGGALGRRALERVDCVHPHIASTKER